MIIANGKRNRLGVLFVCMTALLLSSAVAVVVALRNRQQPAPPPAVLVAVSSAEVRVKAVERKTETVERENVTGWGRVGLDCHSKLPQVRQAKLGRTNSGRSYIGGGKGQT